MIDATTWSPRVISSHAGHVRPPSPQSMAHQRGYGAALQERLRGAAEHPLPEPRTLERAHDDQVGAKGPGLLAKRLRDVAVLRHGQILDRDVDAVAGQLRRNIRA